MPRIHRIMLPLICVFAVLVGTTGAASAATPKPPRTYGTTIEAFTPYVPQTSCDSTLRTGMRAFGALLTRTYPNVSWSSYRPCDGSVSEHHDSRAIDWMASVHDARTRAEATAMIGWLLASDKYGNRFAMARRLGIMYIIYNNRMWGMWSGTWENYLGCMTTKKLKAKSYDDYCHRSHVHLSLSWNGARGKTTFWTGKVSPTDYGPCIPKGKKYAPTWTKVNLTPCSGRR